MAVTIEDSNIKKFGVPDIILSFFRRSVPNLLLALKSEQLFRSSSTLAQLCDTLSINKDIALDIQCQNRAQSDQWKSYFEICNKLLTHSNNINTNDNEKNLSLLFEKYQEVITNPIRNNIGTETVAWDYIEYIWSLANPWSLKDFIRWVIENNYCIERSNAMTAMWDDSKKELSRFLKVMKKFQEGIFATKN